MPKVTFSQHAKVRAPSGFAIPYHFPVWSTCDFAFGHRVHIGVFMSSILGIRHLKGLANLPLWLCTVDDVLIRSFLLHDIYLASTRQSCWHYRTYRLASRFWTCIWRRSRILWTKEKCHNWRIKPKGIFWSFLFFVSYWAWCVIIEEWKTRLFWRHVLCWVYILKFATLK